MNMSTSSFFDVDSFLSSLDNTPLTESLDDSDVRMARRRTRTCSEEDANKAALRILEICAKWKN